MQCPNCRLTGRLVIVMSQDVHVLRVYECESCQERYQERRLEYPNRDGIKPRR